MEVTDQFRSYIVDRDKLMKNSNFFKDLIEQFDNKVINIPTKNLVSFIFFVETGSIAYVDPKEELKLHLYLDCEEYFVAVMNKELGRTSGYKCDKEIIDQLLQGLPEDLIWLCQYHLPLSYLGEKTLTPTFIKKYREIREHRPINHENFCIVSNQCFLGTLVKHQYKKKWYEEGFCFLFWPNNSIRSKWNNAFGVTNGSFESWYENGVPKEKGRLYSETKHGLYEEWYPSGTLKESGYWQDGNRIGLHRRWHPCGALEAEEYHSNNQDEYRYKKKKGKQCSMSS